MLLQFRQHGSMRTLLKTPTVVDDYFQTEAHMWHALKSGPFCFNIVQCARRGVPLCVADWLRMVLLIPFSLSMNQLIRVFEEEDTMTALTSVRSPVALIRHHIKHISSSSCTLCTIIQYHERTMNTEASHLTQTAE